MNVRDLMDRLQTMPPDAYVYVWDIYGSTEDDGYARSIRAVDEPTTLNSRVNSRVVTLQLEPRNPEEERV